MTNLVWSAMVAGLVVAAGSGADRAPAAGKAPGWGPADVCAISARPEAPGYDEIGEGAARVKADAVLGGTNWRIGGWDPKEKIRPEWGPCPIDHVRYTALYFSADGRYAMTEGGWQQGPLAGGEGYCLFEKTGNAWNVLACAITAIS
jgi:hypothetical protein